MPKMKYFQGIADIRDQYEDFIRQADGTYNESRKEYFLKTYPDYSLEYMHKAYNALEYLLGCQHGITYSSVYDSNGKFVKIDYEKPDKEFLISIFEKRLKYIDDVLLFMPKPLLKKNKEVCNYYISKLENNEWFNKLPERILTFEHKYNN